MRPFFILRRVSRRKPPDVSGDKLLRATNVGLNSNDSFLSEIIKEEARGIRLCMVQSHFKDPRNITIVINVVAADAQ